MIRKIEDMFISYSLSMLYNILKQFHNIWSIGSCVVVYRVSNLRRRIWCLLLQPEGKLEWLVGSIKAMF